MLFCVFPMDTSNSRHTTCGTGYTLNFGSGQCEDDDECSTGQHNCHNLGPSYFCRNIQVTYTCYMLILILKIMYIL